MTFFEIKLPLKIPHLHYGQLMPMQEEYFPWFSLFYKSVIGHHTYTSCNKVVEKRQYISKSEKTANIKP